MSCFQPRASGAETTLRMMATPRDLSWVEKVGGGLERSVKERVGMMELLAEAMTGISVLRALRRRLQLARRAGSWLAIKEALREAKRGGRGSAGAPERETKTEEMSPSCFADAAATAAVFRLVGRWLERRVRCFRVEGRNMVDGRWDGCFATL